MANSSEYWRKRYLRVKEEALVDAEQFQFEMLSRLANASRDIEAEVRVWSKKYAKEDGTIDADKAREILRGAENQSWQNTLDEWERKAREGGYDKELNLEYYRSRVSRLQALQAQVANTMTEYTKPEQDNMLGLLTSTYENTYYRTVHNTQLQKSSINVDYAKFNEEQLKQVVSKNWQGSDFSSRLWGNTTKVLPEMLIKAIGRGVTLGYGVDRMVTEAKVIVGNFNKYQLHRLITTEAGHVAEQATLKAYQESGIKKYEYVATFESRTCDVCRALDGRIYEVSKQIVGENYPLIHPNCRCTTAPVIENKYTQENDDSNDNSVQDLISKGIQSEKDLRTIGEVYYDEVFNDKYLAVGDKVKMFEENLKQAHSSFKSDINNSEKYNSYSKAFYDYQNIQEEAQKERMSHVASVLSKYRQVGSNDIKQPYQPRSLKALKDLFNANLDVLPTDWVKTSSDQALMLKHAKRGYQKNGTIAANKDRNVASLRNTLLHEFGHRMEQLRPEIVRMEKEFFERRTQGEEKQSMRQATNNPAYRADEQTRVDNFNNPYMGKEYGGQAFEILSTGLEGVYGGRYDLYTDKDYATFILGILATY